MLIDWFTVGAQALNFIILVWLLKRFLYKPILDAVDAREKRIAAELADAETKKADAQKERETFEHKNQDFDHQRAGLLQRATGEADAERKRLLDEARQVADAAAAKRRDALQNDVVALDQAIRRLTQQEVFAIARKTLADLASASLEQAMTDLFIRRLQALDPKARADIAKAISAASEPAIVRSTFDLPEAQCGAVQKAVREVFAADGLLRFETAPDLVSGIELSAGGQKICWSIADYFAAMEQGVGALVQAKNTSDMTAKDHPKAARKRAVKRDAKAKAARPKATRPKTSEPKTSEPKAGHP
jgi:F-type H+-transporting ATPase subunit b